jgi:superkiller protein 3
MINHTFFKPEDIVELIAKAYYNAALSPDILMQEMTTLLEQLRGDYKTRSYYDIWVRWQYPKEDGFKQSVLKVLVSLKQESGECFKKRLCEHLQAVLKENPESFYTDFMPQYVEAINNWYIDIADAICENCTESIPPQLKEQIQDYRRIHQLIVQSRWAETYDFYATLSEEAHLTNEQKAKLEATAGQIRLYYLDTTPERALVHFEKAKALAPDLARIDKSFGEEKLRGRHFDEARRFFFRALDKKGDDVETQFYVGDSYKDEKNYSAAENWYREGLKNNPFNADFNTRMIRLYSEPDLFPQKYVLCENELAIVRILEPDYPFNNTVYNTYREIAAGYQLNMQYEKAIEWYKKAIDLNEKWIMAWLDLGYTFSMIPNNTEAEKAYQKVIDLAPECFDGYWAMALLHDNQTNYDKAIEYYEICLKLRPEWSENISNTLGVLHYNANRNKKALEYYRKAIDLNPNNALYHENIGLLYERQKDYNNSELSFLKAIELDPKNSALLNRLANVYYDKEDFNKAIEYYQKAIDNQAVSPTQDSVYVENLALAYEKLGELESAKAAYLKATEINPSKADNFNRIGILHYKQGEHEKAIEYYQKAYDIDKNAVYIENIGLAHEGLGNLDKAEAMYQSIFNKTDKKLKVSDYDKASAYNRLAIMYDNNGNYDKAAEYYLIAHNIKPKEEIYMSNLAGVYEKGGQFEKALEIYKNLGELNPRSDNYQNRIAYNYFYLNQLEHVLPYLQKAVELNPSFATYHENIGYYYSSLSKYEEAIPHLENAINLEPNNSARYRKLGTVYRHLKNIDKARYYLEKAIELNPQDADAINDLGVLYFDHQIDDDKAIEYYEKAISINPSIWTYYENLGLAYEVKADTEKAKAAYGKAVELNPHDVQMLLRIIGFYRKIGDDNRLKVLYENVIQLDPNNADCYNNLGVIHFNKNTPEDDVKAQEYYEKAIQYNPLSSIYHENLGWLMYNLKDYVKAYESYQKAYDINPNNALTCYRLGLSYVLTGQNTEGVNYLKKAVVLDANNADYYEDLGTAYFMNKEWYNAAEAFKKTHELNPEHTLIFDRFLECIENLDNKEEAKALLQSFKTTKAEYQTTINQYLDKLV